MATYRMQGFAFNRDNLRDVDADALPWINRHLAAREREINTVQTEAYTCAGGPFDGKAIELQGGADSIGAPIRSAPLQVGTWAGFYEVVLPKDDKSKAAGMVAAVWRGNGAPAAGEAIAFHAREKGRAAATVRAELPKGFSQLGQLLACMAEEQEGEFARFTIGRTSYRVRNTAEAIDQLRARILKAKRHFADKLLSKPKAAEVASVADTVAAVVAIAQAQADAARAPTAEPAGALAMADASDAGQMAATGHAAGLQGHQVAASYSASTGGPAGPGGHMPSAGPDDSDSEQDQAPAPLAHEIEPAALLGDIPQSLARNAFHGVSWTPERRGDSYRADYAATLAADYATLRAQAIKGGTLHLLDEQFSRYREGYRRRMVAWLASQSRCVSSWIAGPANFPAARMNKRADVAHRRMGEIIEYRERARRAIVRTLRPDLRPIMAGDADAADRLAAKIARAEQLHQRMKDANAAIRKHRKAGEAAQLQALAELGYSEAQARMMLKPDSCGRIGFADYELTNNGANIRRMRERLAAIERAQEAPTSEQQGAEGVRLEDDPPANRVRLYYPGKPADQVRAALKAAGFRWAPSLGAWQAYRRHWTLEQARRFAGVDQAPQDLDPPAATAQGVQDLDPPTATAQGVRDLDPPAATAQGVRDLDPPAATAQGVRDLDPPAPAAHKKSTQARDFVPEIGQRAAAKSGAWEAWLYRDASGRPCLVFYRGKAQKPTKRFWFTSEARRMVSLANLAHDAEKAAASIKDKAQARAAELAKPHGLTVGAVLVSSWGYEQTNVDFYQVVATSGRRTVQLRPIASEKHYTGDMQGRCMPCPDQFTGPATRHLVAAGDRVRVDSHYSAAPAEIVGRLPDGGPIYRAYSFSQYG